jgi:hypothetical protein
MNKKIKLREKWQGLTDTVMRFPLTVILLIASIVTNFIAIESDYDITYTRLLITFLLGAALFVVLQLLYERFFDNPVLRIIFMFVTIIFSSIYFMLIRNSEWEIEVTIRTIVLLFILVIAFLWIPSIGSKTSINESFMAAFKGFFTALFFDGVLFLGVVIIISATDLLIFDIYETAYIHSANIIFVLLAPIYFLTMVPNYPRKSDIAIVEESQDNKYDGEFLRLTTPAKFLETLISYVIIPITAVFTVILILYIIINIAGEFWSDNLMEPLLVSYSITVIVVYILASTIKNPFAKYFRMIFPKVLIPVVLFQTLSSILKIADVGITYGRYYVILFGVFATMAGVLFSFLPIRKNGIIAPILIILAVISIVPPVDAFTLSRATQISRLEKVLTSNNMLSEDTLTPNVNLSEEDQSDIVSSLDYLDRMNYTKDIDYLHSYYISFDFEKTFGFDRYKSVDNEYQSYYYGRNTNEPVPIAGNDYMIQLNVHNMTEVGDNQFEVDGSLYSLSVDNTDNDNQIIRLEDAQGLELLRYEYNDLFTKFTGVDSGKEFMSTEEMTFRQENDKAAITMIANNISINEWSDGKDKSAELIILIDIR